ncbi:MAG: hypothetical protein PHT43_03230 [Anaerolineaceae bacterium]|nr:hypothetical protein [Anaerolineaceae bacterium]
MAAIAEHALARIKAEILIDSPEIDSKVDVFIWPSQKDFHQAIASSDISNAGVSQLILAENGRLMRRIDMAASAPAEFVLPHEITHLIIGQLDIRRRNNGQPAIPLALHEGIAILAEGKCNDELLMKAGMALDCIAENGCESASESIARFDRLLNTNDYGTLSDSCNFYAESYSLAEYLMTELKPEGLSRLMTSLGDGLSIDAALQKTICDESDAFKHNLIKKWHAHARNNTSALIAMR